MLASIEKIDALVAGVTKAEIQRMPPAHRQRLAQVLRYIADLADPPKVHSPPRLAYSPSSETVSGWNDIGMGRLASYALAEFAPPDPSAARPRLATEPLRVSALRASVADAP